MGSKSLKVLEVGVAFIVAVILIGLADAHYTKVNGQIKYVSSRISSCDVNLVRRSYLVYMKIMVEDENIPMLFLETDREKKDRYILMCNENKKVNIKYREYISGIYKKVTYRIQEIKLEST